MANVILKDIVKKFGDVLAVNKVNLEIKDQEFVVLVSGCGSNHAPMSRFGRNRCWKLLEILGERCPSQRRDIAMVFQNYALYLTWMFTATWLST